MSLAYCNECETVVEGEEKLVADEWCCPHCDVPIVQLTTEDWREHS